MQEVCKGFIGTHLFGHTVIARPISAQNRASAESRINIAGRLVAPALTGNGCQIDRERATGYLRKLNLAAFLKKWGCSVGSWGVTFFVFLADISVTVTLCQKLIEADPIIQITFIMVILNPIVIFDVNCQPHNHHHLYKIFIRRSPRLSTPPSFYPQEITPSPLRP